MSSEKVRRESEKIKQMSEFLFLPQCLEMFEVDKLIISAVMFSVNIITVCAFICSMVLAEPLIHLVPTHTPQSKGPRDTQDTHSFCFVFCRFLLNVM